MAAGENGNPRKTERDHAARTAASRTLMGVFSEYVIGPRDVITNVNEIKSTNANIKTDRKLENE
jgi:hypothetical protein